MSVDISVITPTFRRPAELSEAVRSALSQTGFEVEVIVLDDSPEGSARDAIATLKDPRIQYVHREVPTGGCPARVRNDGWKLAKGDLLHFLDDDDRVVPGAYAKLAGALKENPNVGVAFGVVEPFGDNAKVLADQKAYFEDAARRARMSQKLGSKRMMVANMLFMPTVLVNSAGMVRRSCLEPLNGYNENLAVFEDVDFYLRAIRRFDCVFVDSPVLEYRTGAPSIMHNLEDNSRGSAAYREMQDRYRAEYGSLEFAAMKLISRTVLKAL